MLKPNNQNFMVRFLYVVVMVQIYSSESMHDVTNANKKGIILQ